MIFVLSHEINILIVYLILRCGPIRYGAVLKASRGEGRGHGADIPASSSPMSKPNAASLSGFTTPMRFHKTHSASRSSSSRRESKEGIKGRRPLSGKVYEENGNE